MISIMFILWMSIRSSLSEELVKLKAGAYQKEYPLLTSLIQEIEKPEILFLTALLHDIGKGGKETIPSRREYGGSDRRPNGALSGRPKELMAFLVRHHLFMLETAFRRDLHEEQNHPSLRRRDRKT